VALYGFPKTETSTLREAESECSSSIGRHWAGMGKTIDEEI
jgi:hypothetical protein